MHQQNLEILLFRIQQLLHRIILWKHIFMRKSILLHCKKLYFKTFCFSFLKGKAFCFFVRNYISEHFASASHSWKEKHFALASEIKFFLLLVRNYILKAFSFLLLGSKGEAFSIFAWKSNNCWKASPRLWYYWR